MDARRACSGPERHGDGGAFLTRGHRDERPVGGVHERAKLPAALAHGEEVDRDAGEEDEDGADERERVAPWVADARVHLFDAEAHVAQVDLGPATNRLENFFAPVAVEECDQRRERVEDDGDADERVHTPALTRRRIDQIPRGHEGFGVAVLSRERLAKERRWEKVAVANGGGGDSQEVDRVERSPAFEDLVCQAAEGIVGDRL